VQQEEAGFGGVIGVFAEGAFGGLLG
ncbi:MAG: hypothetical protein RIS92_1720, partial [Verrucomicrobiota bacterium]